MGVCAESIPFLVLFLALRISTARWERPALCTMQSVIPEFSNRLKAKGVIDGQIRM